MIGGFVFSELSPNAPGTAVSSAPVTSAAPTLGVATPLDDFDSLDVAAEIQGATGGTLDVYVQCSPDGGNNWYDVIHFTQAAAGSGVKYYQAPLSLATNTTAPVAVGKNLAPALGSALASVVNGAFTDRLRLVMVAGTGTTAGALVIVRMAPQRIRVTT